MRVTKNEAGEFIVEDEPMRLNGDAADEFLDEMARRDREEPTVEQKRFLEECDRVYQANKAKLGQ